MDKEQINRVKNLMLSKGITYPQLSKDSGVSVITLRRLINEEDYNPTIDTIKKVAIALGVDYLEILEGKEFKKEDFLGVRGYVDFRGEIKRISSFKDLKEITTVIDRQLQSPKLYKDLLKEDKANLKTQAKTPIDISTINLFKEEEYDTKSLYTWSFRKSEDEKEGIENDLGNMCKGYPFKVCGEKFLNSECAYICGLFSQNTPKAIEIQRELQASDNGYNAKKAIRRKYEQVGLGREDWESFNVQWMLFVVWQKVSQNKEFAKKLKAIPPYAMIVENSTYQKGETSRFWGMKNEGLQEALEIAESATEITNLSAKKKALEGAKKASRNSLNHIGIWKGVNCMGKILTICKHCLENGIEPPIDYNLLRSKQIYLFGKLLTFDNS